MKKNTTPIGPVVRERRIAILKALAHESRMLMVEALAGGALCVCELQQLTGGDMSTVSKHLTILRNAGLVRDERRGVKVFYHLVAPCVLQIFDCLEKTRENTCQHQSK